MKKHTRTQNTPKNPRIDNIIEDIEEIEEELRGWVRKHGSTEAAKHGTPSKQYFTNFLSGRKKMTYNQILEISRILLPKKKQGEKK